MRTWNRRTGRGRLERPVAVAASMLAVLLAASASPREDAPRLADIDRVRLAEAFRLSEEIGDRLWRGWSGVPFAVLLVAPGHEFLVRHPKPSGDFRDLGFDATLRSRVHVRGRTQSETLLATFPAVGGVSTVVVGRAEATAARTSTPWVVTLLHEHLHQYQESDPGYYGEVEALGLARGDTTGMWMLNYDFPYDAPGVASLARDAAGLLEEAIEADGGRFTAALRAYVRARGALIEALDPDDARYLEFQVWKEGIARYAQYRVAALAAEGVGPGEGFRALKDFQPYGEVAAGLRADLMLELRDLDLPKARRVAFYSIGAGEGLLLDRADPGWRARYAAERFRLGGLLREAAEHPGSG